MLLFPFDKVSYNSKIVLYGAGSCGIAFFRQIINSQYCELILWVDRNAEFFKTSKDRLGMTFPVSSVDRLMDLSEYDYVVIAIVNPTISEEIRNDLLNKYNVPNEKIIATVHDYSEETVYGNYTQEGVLGNLETNDSKIELVSPEKMVSPNELTIMPRYLVAKDIKNGIANEANLSLYKRVILAQGDLFTGRNYFSQRNKHTLDEFVRDFNKLVNSIERSDFARDSFIPVVAGNRIVLDGQHRIAASLALEKDVFAKYYPDHEDYGCGFGLTWLSDNGFSTEDIQRILYAYTDCYKECGIYVLFGTEIEKWDYLVKQIGRSCTVVGYVDLDFSRDYVAFENVIRELYLDPLWRNVQIHLKTKLLKFAPLTIRVVVVSNQERKTEDIYSIITNTKAILREACSVELEKDTGAVVHASSNLEEFVNMKELLLSPNSIRSMSCMFRRAWSKEKVEQLKRLENALMRLRIKKEDIAITSGSVLEIFGLRESKDIDIVCKSKHRSILSEMKTNDFDICGENSVKMQNGVIIPDDILIDDPNFHFIFYGFKFVNLEIVCGTKRSSNQEKDLEDVKLIELFNEYVNNFDDKYVLRKQIDKELYLKRYL